MPCPACPVCTTPVVPDKICPTLPDPRVFGLPAGVDTILWVRLDSISRALYDSSGGILGAFVVRTRDSQLVWSRNPDLRTLPASTMKFLTAAAALEDLGPEFRWKTTVWATGPVVKGVLKGDLVLEGGGDPTLGVDGAGMGPFVNAVLRKGIKRVEGSLVALDTLVGRDGDVWPQGWSIGNSHDGYGAPVTGLNWAHNRTRYRSFPEPRKLALLTFSKSLRARKVAIDRTDTLVLARGDSMPNRRKWTLVARIQSPKLSEVLRICLVHSVNAYAEAAVLALGTRRPNPKYAPRDQGRRRFRQILTSMGVPASVVADDGSGLSRMDLVTARAMAEMLRRDLRQADGLRATDLLPRGGQGTIRFRFGRLPDPSRVSAKTGTLDGTSSLVGILRVPGRDTLAFAFLSSGYRGPAKSVRGFHDRLLLSLSGIEPRLGLDTLSTLSDSLEDGDNAPPPPPSPSTPVPDSTPIPSAADDTASVPAITSDRTDFVLPPSDTLALPLPPPDTTRGETPEEAPKVEDPRWIDTSSHFEPAVAPEQDTTRATPLPESSVPAANDRLPVPPHDTSPTDGLMQLAPPASAQTNVNDSEAVPPPIPEEPPPPDSSPSPDSRPPEEEPPPAPSTSAPWIAPAPSEESPVAP